MFHELLLHFSNASNLHYNDNAKLLELVSKRKEMVVGPVQLAANLLEPYLMGRNLSGSEYIDALTFIYTIAIFFTKDNEIGTIMPDIAM